MRRLCDAVNGAVDQAEPNLDKTVNHHPAHILRYSISGFEGMAIEQLFEALPLHYLQHGISKFGATNVALAFVVTASLGVLADYAWMLHLRSKMVGFAERSIYLDAYVT